MSWFTDERYKDVFRGDTKTIGKVEWTVEKVLGASGQMEAVATVRMNDKEYQMLHTMNIIVWNDNAYLHDMTKSFLYKIALQEYDIEFYQELSTEQIDFLGTLKEYTIEEGLMDEKTFIENVIESNGYGNSERMLINRLKEKYIKERVNENI